MARNAFETLIGALVLCVALGFIVIAYKGGNVEKPGGIMLTARFDRIDGLSVGSNVRISGLNVGSVMKQSIDPETFMAIVKITLDDSIKLPNDSSAEIVSDGLLGSKYIALIPGGSDAMFRDGDEIEFTQSSVSIEALIGKFMFGGANEEDSEKDNEDIF